MASNKILRIVLLVGLACVNANRAFGEESSYLRGYIDALMQSRFPGLGLHARTIDADKRVTVSSGTCLGHWQKRNIAWLLEEVAHVKAVIWDKTADCSQPGDRPAPEGKKPDIEMNIQALPEQAMFAPLIADPRQPRFSVSYQRYHIADTKFDAASVAFGEYFGLASGVLGNSGSSDIGLQGAVFALFNLDTPSNDLINADYWIGIPITYRKENWSYMLQYYHQSSHLGDEFILGNPGVTRINLSYEDVELLASYEWEKLRLYGGGGYIVNSEPDIAPKHWRAGMEFVHPRAIGGLDFIAALDMQSSQELAWERSYSAQAGFEFKNGSNRRLRLMLEHFHGHSPNGQFFREYLRYNGIGLYFGF